MSAPSSSDLVKASDSNSDSHNISSQVKKETGKDEVLSKDKKNNELYSELHCEFILSLDSEVFSHTLEYALSHHLKMSVLYWATASIILLGKEDKLDKGALIKFVLACQTEDGGFAGNIGHHSHLLYTTSAIQILAMLNSLHLINTDKVVKYICKLENSDGSFSGDSWGEVDTRFSYCALLSLSIMNKLSLDQTKNPINLKRTTNFVLSCHNFDGGFGAIPGGESHGGQTFPCLGALHLGGALTKDFLSNHSPVLAWWLCERQTTSGGFNGRPEKKQDVCYSWWVLSSLAMLCVDNPEKIKSAKDAEVSEDSEASKTLSPDNKDPYSGINWIDREALSEYILTCQDNVDGGISDRPGNQSDIFHTFFGIAGLSLLHWEGPGAEGKNKLLQIDPVFALPTVTLQRLNLRSLSDLINQNNAV